MNNEQLKKFFSNKWIKRSVQLVIIISCSVFIYQNVKQINLRSIEINYWFLFLSLFLTMTGTYLGAYSWWITLRSIEQRLSIEKIREIQFKSNLAKYIPGYGWQLVGKSYMSIANELPTAKVWTALIFEYAEIFLTGIFLVAIILPSSFREQINQQGVSDIVISLIQAVLGLLLLCSPFIINFFTKLFRIKNVSTRLNFRWVVMLIILLLVIWIINSAGFYFLINAIGQYSDINFISTIFIMTITFLVGLLIIFIPGSLGIREALFIFWLTPFMSPSHAGLIAITYRVITVTSEVLVMSLNNVRYYMTNWKRKNP